MTNTCIHYWILEPNNGLESKGICKYCGKVGVFPNICSIENYTKALVAANRANLHPRSRKGIKNNPKAGEGTIA